MGRRKSTQMKERNKAFREQQREKIPSHEELSLIDKISDLKSCIHCCECDLNNPAFRGNQAILSKIENMKESILKLENELKEKKLEKNDLSGVKNEERN